MIRTVLGAKRIVVLKYSIPVQLKAKECRMVLGVCNAAKTPEQKVWKELDLRLTDAANESKDNVKFLSTLEKTLEPMYEGSPKVSQFCVSLLDCTG